MRDKQPIFKVSVARKLLRYGFPIRDIEENPRNKNKVIFFFDRSQELYSALKNIMKE